MAIEQWKQNRLLGLYGDYAYAIKLLKDPYEQTQYNGT